MSTLTCLIQMLLKPYPYTKAPYVMTWPND